ncbi:EF-hand domain-containing protein [Duganella sp. FT92W]|uniref:EF-hand domain-containing protein n=1 Tax=Pseudoduganella rivuli TaxID=2666085 RepID=A0A7X2IR18_9BURK|nr:EF-hand domain-containing protein [Pseudoduganella rivuli]MRV74398.1 EF-hand domain-containing protein [Pseudoduganella rivuli]
MMNKLILMAIWAYAAAAPVVHAAGGGQDPAVKCADPCVPQHLRNAPATAPASGEALQRQALAKLRQRFNEADLDANGALTEEEARKAGLGYVANHFADIDTARSGKVTFDDLRNYMSKRRKQALGPGGQ